MEKLSLHLMRAGLELLARHGEIGPLTTESPRAAAYKPPQRPVAASQSGDKPGPGCMAADEYLTVRGHLDGVVKGYWGTGVLQHDIARMDRVIANARAMGDAATAQELAAIKAALPEVRDQARAAQVLEKAEVVVPKVGELAKRCGASVQGKTGLSDELKNKVKTLGEQVKRGEITRDAAIKQIEHATGATTGHT